VKDPANVPSSGGSALPGATSSGLLEGVRQRDPDAWRQLAVLYGPLVLRWCRRAGVPAVEAEDVLQEVLLTVAARIADFRHDRPGDTFRGWLWTITRNKVGDWLQRQATREQAAGGTDNQQLLQEAPDRGLGDEPEPADVGALYRHALEQIRGEFEPVSWQAFWRVSVEDRRPADVAAELGISRNAVYIARSRILHRLRELLGE
jgi:RNA polymerase sigma-70 factor (ECF subfamily)